MMNNLYQDAMFNQISQQAVELKKNLKGNPQEIVMNMLNSGQIPQPVFNKVFPIAMQMGEKMSKK